MSEPLKPAAVKTCVGCVNFHVAYEEDWSEATAGDGFTMDCDAQKFFFGEGHRFEEDFERCITTAQKCELFQLKPEFLRGPE